MDDLPRQKLCELIATYGRSVCDDPRRCEGLLRDYCGAYKREVHVLVGALRERVAADLLGSQCGVPHEVVVARLAKRLQDDLGLGEDAARWAVESWALALGVIARAPEGSSPKGNAAGRQASREKKREPVMQGKADAEQPRLHVDKTHGWPKLLALAFVVMAGAAVVWWGTSLNEKQGRVMIDRGAGREVVIKPNHSLTMDQTAEETESGAVTQPASDINLSGTWITSDEEVFQITQTGSSVTGRSRFKKWTVTCSGTFDGTNLTLKCNEAHIQPSYTRSSTMKFTLSGDGTRLDGQPDGDNTRPISLMRSSGP